MKKTILIAWSDDFLPELLLFHVQRHKVASHVVLKPPWKSINSLQPVCNVEFHHNQIPHDANTPFALGNVPYLNSSFRVRWFKSFCFSFLIGLIPSSFALGRYGFWLRGGILFFIVHFISLVPPNLP